MGEYGEGMGSAGIAGRWFLGGLVGGWRGLEDMDEWFSVGKKR